jgi:hypothetical protein
MKGERVRSWEHLASVVFENSYRSDIGRFRSPYAFRGMCADWDLSTSVQRLGYEPEQLPMIEQALLRNFRKYAFRDADPAYSEWKWLALAQHHGLPTRLLDWTHSPFVAMHFATNELDKMNVDGVIWMVHFKQLHDSWLPDPLRQVLWQHHTLTFGIEMLEEKFSRISDVENQKGAHPDFVMFFEPPSLDARIVNQLGLFSFMNRPQARLHDWLIQLNRPRFGVVRKLIVPAKLKWEVRDKLDHMNITERVLMPGLDGLSTWLKRWYSPGIKFAASQKTRPRRTAHVV